MLLAYIDDSLIIESYEEEIDYISKTYIERFDAKVTKKLLKCMEVAGRVMETILKLVKN